MRVGGDVRKKTLPAGDEGFMAVGAAAASSDDTVQLLMHTDSYGPFLQTLTCLNFHNFSRRDMATCYGLDGPGIESWWQRDFPHPSRPTPVPTQPPLQRVTSHSRGVRRPERGGDHQPSSSKEASSFCACIGILTV